MHVICKFVTLHGRGDSADVIKLMKLRWGEYPRLLEKPQYNHKGPLKRGQGSEDGDVTVEAEVKESKRDLKMLHSWLWSWRKGPQTKECRQPLEAEQAGKGFSWKASRGTQSCQHLDVRISDYRIVNIGCFKALNLWSFVIAAIGS